jgi:hypothetical protein
MMRMPYLRCDSTVRRERVGRRTAAAERRGVRCLLGLLCVVIAGCSGGGAASAPRAPLPACPFNESIFGSTTLISPANGARGVPTTIGGVGVTYIAELVGVTVMLVPSPTSAPSPVISGGQFATSVLGTTLAASVPLLRPATDYSVQATTQHTSSTCTQTVSYYLGSFST